MGKRRMRQKDAIVLSGVLALMVLILLFPVWSGFTWGNGGGMTMADKEGTTGSEEGAASEAAIKTGKKNGKKSILDPKGKNLEQRIRTPKGYERESEAVESLATFLRTYSLKKDGSPVKLYDGSRKENQDAHMAVFKLPLEKQDLQQCADTVMRVYAEYYWKTDQKEKISFRFVDGFQADYTKWREGYRIRVGANSSTWVDSKKAYDDSYDNFKEYLRMVFSYASTFSLKEESKKIKISKIQVGDIFIRSGSPGHVVLVVDVCENAEGEKAFLLGQGFMPAQQFQLLKNPLHEEDPWYYENEFEYPLETPEYTFDKGSLMRPGY